MATPSTVKPDEKKPIYETPTDLERAIDEKRMDGGSMNFEVSPKLFAYLVRDGSAYATYKGAKIFTPGTKAELLRTERMAAEDYGNLKAREHHEKTQKRIERELNDE